MYISRLDYLLTGLMMFFSGFLWCRLWDDLKKSWNDDLDDESNHSDNK